MSEPDSTTKRCSQCGETKPLSAFYKNKNTRDGLSSQCGPCLLERSKEYAARNREAIAERKKAARIRDREKISDYNAKYAVEHADELREKRLARYHEANDEAREKRAEQDREYRERNKEAIRTRRRSALQNDPDLRRKNIDRAAAWYLKNRGRVSEKNRARYAARRDEIRQRIKRYVINNPDKVRLLGRVKAHRRRLRIEASGGTHSAKEIRDLLAKQRFRCAACHKSIRSAFHIDHRIPVSKGGSNDIGNIDLLCPSCNIRKSNKMPEEFAREIGRLI